MDISRWCRTALVYWLLLCACGVASGRQGDDGLERAVREVIRQEIEKGPLGRDPDFLAEFLQRYDETPKLRCSIDGLTVYRDGVVCRAVLASDLPFNARLRTEGRTLSLCNATLTDGSGGQWDLPPLRAHYYFGRVREERTLLIRKGESARILVADTLESPRLVRVDPPHGEVAEKPAELRYTVRSYSHAYTADLREWKPVYWIGQGKILVEWKDVLIPRNLRTSVIEPQGPPKQ
jgi:hypothetical protein